MSETSATTEVASQYAARVASDLESNAKEQERIGAEIVALQEQLTALQHDHRVLVNIQQALAGAAPAAGGTPVPSPRKDAVAEPAPGRKGTRARKGGASAQSPVAKKSTAKKASAAKAPAKAAGAKAAGPTLVELVRRHLVAQSEPRSAAEVSAALAQDHPERPVRTTVVRNTLEGLVAKQQAQRTKQGSSVYYTAIGAPEPAPAPEPASQAESK
ncbi:hypothetical protein ACH5AJ_33660 [Streptomyces rochei]|uniref:Regulatory protein n=1 Tax=Streptomyces vinaceusdrappus TaxID=67376 RepID=A0ABY6C8G6_9ACTN|nr:MULTISPECIES: hypothetical protein [Streptomyces]NUV96889.1 hypothetical protein [Streptomyces sp. KAI 90]RSS23557.1 hypothetical protein EF916_30340 [Streptomyces sp. WAC08452]UXI82939.1 hypothetical protein N6Q81_35275 [Streptomyces vinaceusdrappus]